MTKNYCVCLMQTLLDLEWQQAADAFKGDATSANWGRMDRIMHARQCWAAKDDQDQELRMQVLIHLPIPEWVGELYQERIKGQALPVPRPAAQAAKEARASWENLDRVIRAHEVGFQEGLIVRLESEGPAEIQDKNLARLIVAEAGKPPVRPR